MTTGSDVFDSFEQQLRRELSSRAELMPTPDHGLDLIRARVARRRRRRAATWVVATAAGLVVVGAIVGVVFRSTAPPPTPYVDTSTSTVDPDAPATVPARALPGLVPGAAYRWWLSNWFGPSGYTLGVLEADESGEPILVQVAPGDPDAPPPTAHTARDGSLVDDDDQPVMLGPDGGVVQIDRRGPPFRARLTWSPQPELTVSVRASGTDDAAAVERALAVIEALGTVAEPEWHDTVLEYVDRSHVLVLDPDETWLVQASSPSAVEASPSTATNLSFWTSAVGWGQLYLAQSLEEATESTEGAPVGLRGVTGRHVDYVATSEGEHVRFIEWTEGGGHFVLTFGASLTLEDALAIAERLHPITAAEAERLLFPTWEPAEVRELYP